MQSVMKICLRFLAHLLVFLPSLHASVIGTSKPSEPITEARIAELPAKDRAAWSAYLERSQKQRQTDQAAPAECIASDLPYANPKPLD